MGFDDLVAVVTVTIFRGIFLAPKTDLLPFLLDLEVVVDFLFGSLNNTRQSSSYSSPKETGITEFSRSNESDGDIDDDDVLVELVSEGLEQTVFSVFDGDGDLYDLMLLLMLPLLSML